MLNSSGVGVYLKECLKYFLESTHNIILLGSRETLNQFKNHTNSVIIPYNIKPFSIKELFFFPRKIIRIINKADAYYSPYFNIPCGIKVSIYTTIHDIIFPDMPELSSKFGLYARMFFYHRCFKLSKKIFTVSEFSKSRIDYYSKEKKPIIVTYAAIQKHFLECRKEQKTIKKRETIVFIGNLKKHKGLSILIEAFTFAKKEGLPHKLIIIGGMNNFRSADKDIHEKIASMDKNDIELAENISSEQLINHLSSASLLIQPSLYEGFCLPPLEALVLGTHALISDIPVLKEIYKDFPVTFFEAGNSNDLKDKMIQILSQSLPPPVLSEELLNKYTFDKTVSIILKELQ